jgi:hypothetical protein
MFVNACAQNSTIEKIVSPEEEDTSRENKGFKKIDMIMGHVTWEHLS